MDNDTRILYDAALAAGLTAVGVFCLSAYGYILIAPTTEPWLPPEIEGWRFLGAAPVFNYAPLGSFATGETINHGVVLLYYDIRTAYDEE